MSGKLESLLRRGRIVKTVLNAKRALVQLVGYADDDRDKIELMLPYGFSAKPTGGDVVLLQIGASASHAVALFGDDPALRIGDLADGEFGFRDRNGQQVVFRSDRIEITTPAGKNLVMTIGGDLEQTVTGNVTQTVHGDATTNAGGNVTVTAGGNASVNGTQVLLGGGGKRIALDKDMVVDGVVMSTSTKVKGT